LAKEDKKTSEDDNDDAVEIVFFKSDSCAFCPRAEEVITDMMEDFGESALKLTIINVSENPGAAEDYGIFALPTTMIGGVSVTGIPEPEILMKMILGSKISSKRGVFSE
jgi:thiol-disulfide isomerase/thioredoxin